MRRVKVKSALTIAGCCLLAAAVLIAVGCKKPTDIIPSYKIIFDSNEGTGTPPDPITISDAAAGAGAVAPGKTGLERRGYTFDGWNTKADGSGTPYAENTPLTALATSVFTSKESVTLYAKWATVDYTLTYNANDGSGVAMPTAATFTVETTDLTAAEVPTGLARTGYTFDGWNTETDGSGTPYAAGANLTAIATAAENVTLYVKWNSTTG